MRTKLLESPVATHITIILISFFLYISSISPTIYWRDSPEFVDVAYTLGISHPAGSPAYSIITRIFTFLPFFSIPFKINLTSLFFALLTIFFTCKVIQCLLSFYYTGIKKSEINLILILCSLLLTIMPSFWLKAIVAEVYTMNAFFLVLILYMLLKWSSGNDRRYVLLAAFLYGLSTGVHAGVIFFLPGLLIFFLLVHFNPQCRKYRTPKKNKEFIDRSLFKSFTLVFLFFLLGFSIYLYLPIRSITNPEFDWGNPETLNNFYSHISDKKDSASHFKNIFQINSLLKDGPIFVKMVVGEITLIGILLFVTGMINNFKENRKTFILLFLIAFINTMFYLTSTFGVYKNAILFIPSFIIFIIWIALGICFIRNGQIKKLPGINLKRLSVPLVLAFLSFSLITNHSTIEKSNYYFVEDFIKEMYLDIDTNSILFSSQHWFAYRYFQDVENLRSDLIIIHTSDMKDPDIFNPVTNQRYPMLQFPEMASSKDTFYDFWPLLIKENIKKRNIFVDLNSVVLDIDSIPILPYKKFLMRIVNTGQDNYSGQAEENYLKELQISINKDISQLDFFHDQEEGVKTYYNIFLYNFANYLRQKGNFNMSISFLNLAESLTSKKAKGIATMKAICLAELGRYNESSILLKNLLTEYPDDKSILTNLGNLYLKMKDYRMAEKHLRKVVRIDENSPKAHFLLGMIYSSENRIDESIIEIEKAFRATKHPLKRKKMEQFLKKILVKKTQNSKL